jgi:Zn-finger protein
MAQEAHLLKVRKTGLRNNRQQHATGCEQLHIDVEVGQLTIYCTATVRRELRDQFIVARNGKPLWSMKACVRTVHEIEHHDVVSLGILVDEFRDKGPREWTKQALKTLEEATELYMVEVIAESSF